MSAKQHKLKKHDRWPRRWDSIRRESHEQEHQVAANPELELEQPMLFKFCSKQEVSE